MTLLLGIAAFITGFSSIDAARIAVARAEPSCTVQMGLRPFTTQADAQIFGRACLLRQGATPRTLTRAQVLALLEQIIGPDHELAAATPSDIPTFCPPYLSLSAADRAQMWRSMLAAISRPESNFKSAEPYWEVGQRQYSIGLLQLSLSDEANYRCGLQTEIDLTSPQVNLTCGAKILTRWIVTDGRIGGDAAHRTLGAGRYWSTMRERRSTPPGAPPTSARGEILSVVRALPVCATVRSSR